MGKCVFCGKETSCSIADLYVCPVCYRLEGSPTKRKEEKMLDCDFIAKLDDVIEYFKFKGLTSAMIVKMVKAKLSVFK